MKFREVSAKRVQVGGAAALLTVGGGATWMIRSIRRKLKSTDKQRRDDALAFLLRYPLFFKSFFKQDVRQLALKTTAHIGTRQDAFLLLALHDEDGFREAIRTVNIAVRHSVARYLKNDVITSQKNKDSVQRAISASEELDVTDGPTMVTMPRPIDLDPIRA